MPAVKDAPQDAFNRDVAAFVKVQAGLPWALGVLHEDIDVSNVTLKLLHGLDRVPRGYIVLRKTGPGDLWLPQAADKTYLYLLADADFTVDLWVF